MRRVFAAESPVNFPILALTIVRPGWLLFCSFSGLGSSCSDAVGWSRAGAAAGAARGPRCSGTGAHALPSPR